MYQRFKALELPLNPFPPWRLCFAVSLFSLLARRPSSSSPHFPLPLINTISKLHSLGVILPWNNPRPQLSPNQKFQQRPEFTTGGPCACTTPKINALR